VGEHADKTALTTQNRTIYLTAKISVSRDGRKYGLPCPRSRSNWTRNNDVLPKKRWKNRRCVTLGFQTDTADFWTCLLKLDLSVHCMLESTTKNTIGITNLKFRLRYVSGR